MEDISKMMRRKARVVEESAFVPNSIEVGAIKDMKMGLYPSSEMVFVRRFPHSRKTVEETAKKAAADYGLIKSANPHYKPLFFPLRKRDCMFSVGTMDYIENAQKDHEHFVFHEPNINQSYLEYVRLFQKAAEKHDQIIPVLDPGMLSPKELEKKAEFVAKQNPKLVLIHHRHPFEFQEGYLAIMKHLVDLKTRVIDVGIWPRYVTKGQYFGFTLLPVPVMFYGVDAVCNGAGGGGWGKPSIVFLNGTEWQYVNENLARGDNIIDGKSRGDYLKEGRGTDYWFSRVDAVLEGDRHLRVLRAMKSEELVDFFQNSGFLKDVLSRFNAFWQEG